MKTPDSEPDMPDDAWDDLFRQRLADYTDQPPADSLFRILAGAGRSPIRFYRRLLPVSLAMLLLTGVGSWLYTNQRETPSEAVANTKVQPNPVNPMREPVADAHARKAAENRAVVAENKSAQPHEKVAAATAPSMDIGPEGARPDRVAGLGMNSRGRAADKTHETRTTLPASKDRQTTDQEPAYVTRSAGRDYVAGYSSAIRLSRVRSALRSTTDRGEKNSIVLPTHAHVDEANFSEQQLSVIQAAPGNLDPRLPSVDKLAGRTFRAFATTVSLPLVAVALAEPIAPPKAIRPAYRPTWFASLTPLYNYQQINPIHTDAEFVSDIRVAHPLSINRLGGRFQLGMEWQVADRLSLRTSLVYQQVRQSLHYAVRSTRPDSVRIVANDNQSVQVTPFFTKRNCEETAIWHYTGISSDLVWQLNRTTSRHWQHYLTAGATVGRYVSRGGSVNGFVQAAYGIERPLTTNVRLRIEPTIQLGWEALTDQARRFNNRPYSYGFAVGVRFR